MKWFEQEEIVIKQKVCTHPAIERCWQTGSMSIEDNAMKVTFNFLLKDGSRQSLEFTDMDSQDQLENMERKIIEFLDNIPVDAEMSAE